MSIYIRKKKKNIFKTIILTLLIILLLIFLGFYFFSSIPHINLSTNIKNLNEKEILINKEKYDDILEPFKNQLESELTQYVTKDEINNNIKNFIENNPDFLIKVLTEYQNKQNELEKQKISEENISNIQKLNSTDLSMFIGSENSSKIIFEFVDYNCGYCLKFHNEVMNVISKDPSIKLVIIQMPILGTMSDELSKLAFASSFQGKFNEVHNYLYSSDRKSNINDILSDLFLMNVDLAKLESDLVSEKVEGLISKHQNIVNDFKFTGTPAIIIGNTIIPGFIKSDKIFEIVKKEFP